MDSKSSGITLTSDALNEFKNAQKGLALTKSSSPSKETSTGTKRTTSEENDINVPVIVTGITVGSIIIAGVIKGLLWDEKEKVYGQHEKRISSSDILKQEVNKSSQFMVFQFSSDNNASYVRFFLKKSGLDNAENVATLLKEPTNIYTHVKTGVINNTRFMVTEDGDQKFTNLRHVTYFAPTNIDSPDAKKAMGTLFDMISEVYNKNEFRVNSFGPLKRRKIKYNLHFQEVKIDDHLQKSIGSHFLLFSTAAKAFIDQEENNLTPQEDDVVAAEVVLPTTPVPEPSVKKVKK